MKGKPSKAERRRQRQEERAQECREKSTRLVANLPDLGVKKIKVATIPHLSLKVVRSQENPARDKSIYSPSVDEFSNECSLTWCTTHSDLAGKWSWHEQRLWTKEEWEGQILPSFQGLENSRWSEILFEQTTPAKHGKTASRNHYQELSTLLEEAQHRWMEIGLEEYDTAFRFRFGATIRAWGIKMGGHFYLVWWERYHRIYPVG